MSRQITIRTFLIDKNYRNSILNPEIKQKSMENNPIINHIAFVIDASSSMQPLRNDVVKVFDDQIQHLARQANDQETRVSIYYFADSVSCHVFDVDCLRVKSIKDSYKPYGNTALIDATLQAIEEAEQICEMRKNSSHLAIILSDGATNRGKTGVDLAAKLNKLKDNFTVAFLAPNQHAVYEAKKAGFPAQNIQVWDITSSKGIEEAGKVIRDSIDNYMVGRSTGMKSTKNLFKVDANFTKTDIKTQLQELSPTEYEILDVRKKTDIQSFVLSWKLPFRKGSNFFELQKPETVQPYKQAIVMLKSNGKLYGGSNARKMLNLPDYEVKITPGDFKDYRIFLSSSSTNRNLVPGSQLIVLK